MITHDPKTWPSNDPIWDICRAVAFAEGADIEGSVPDRLNNPGDISDFLGVFGSEFHNGSKVTRFPTKEAGWAHLHWKFKRVVDGESHIFLVSYSWLRVARKYAKNWEPWLKIVTEKLGVTIESTPLDYVRAHGYEPEGDHSNTSPD